MATLVASLPVVEALLKDYVPKGAGEEPDDAKECNFFRDKDPPYGGFANFYDAPITLKKGDVQGNVPCDVTCATTEHTFQAMKFAHSEKDFMDAAQAESGKAAAKVGRDRSRPLRKDWEKVKKELMFQLVLVKFQQHADLRELLLSTSDLVIVERSEKDDYWGDGGNGKGKNMLGKILMAVRWVLRNPDDAAAAATAHTEAAKLAGKEWLDSQGVTEAVATVLKTIVEEQPAEPFAALATGIRARIDARDAEAAKKKAEVDEAAKQKAAEEEKAAKKKEETHADAAKAPMTLAEVKQHNTPDDLYVVVSGKVYDVTKWAPVHPAGAQSILNVAGSDCTDVFLMMHSPAAKKLLQTYYVCDLKSEASSLLSVASARATATAADHAATDGYETYEVTESTSISESVKRISFKAASDAAKKATAARELIPGGHFSVRVPKFEDEYRSYSPVSYDGAAGTFDVMVRQYPGGKGSTHMHALKVGETTEMRGPIPPMFDIIQARPAIKRTLVLVGGGTGMAPMFAVALAVRRDNAVKGNNPIGRVVLFGCFRNEADMLFPDEAEQLQTDNDDAAKVNGCTIDVHFCLSQQGETPLKTPRKNVHLGRVCQPFVETAGVTGADGSGGASQVVICGPGAMNKAARSLFFAGLKWPEASIAVLESGRENAAA